MKENVYSSVRAKKLKKIQPGSNSEGAKTGEKGEKAKEVGTKLGKSRERD
jgi:hypothetical protein